MKTLKSFSIWLCVHSAHWGLLYAAFWLDNYGALRVVLFACWVLALLSLYSTTDQSIADAAKRPARRPIFQLLNWFQAWCTLGLLIWHGHFAAGSAWLLTMVCLGYSSQEVRKARAALSSTPTDSGSNKT